MALHTAFAFSIVAGIVLTVVGIFLTRPALLLMKTPADVVEDSAVYLHIYFGGMVFNLVYNMGAAILRAVGDSKRPLYVLIITCVLNIILDLLFVVAFGMGVTGVAVATVTSQVISALIVTVMLLKTREIYVLKINQIRFDRRMLFSVLRIGIPAGLQNAIFQIANLFVEGGVYSFVGTLVAGYGAGANADALVFVVMWAFYTACGSFMGQNFGAGNRKRVRNSYLISLAYSFGIGMIMGLGLVLFGHQFLSLFSTDADVIEAGMIRLSIMGVCYGFSAFMDCTIMASRALGKSMIPMVIVIIGSCVFRVIWIYTVFAYFHTILSLYSLYIFSWGITPNAEIIYFVYIYKKRVC